MRDGERIDTLMRALYESLSGGPGEQDWERAAALFYPRATLARTEVEDGMPCAWLLSYPEYAQSVSAVLAGVALNQTEVRREVKRFGQIAEVFSAYEARIARDADEERVVRGINLLHLWYDGGRWWIMQMIGEEERDGAPLPLHWLAEPDLAG